MTFQVQQADQLSIKQMEEFLQGSCQMEFTIEGRAEVYGLIERVLSHCHYSKLGKRERGVARAYLIKLTDLSRAQTTRLIGRWSQSREVRPLPARGATGPCDVALLARVDA